MAGGVRTKVRDASITCGAGFLGSPARAAGGRGDAAGSDWRRDDPGDVPMGGRALLFIREPLRRPASARERAARTLVGWARMRACEAQGRGRERRVGTAGGDPRGSSSDGRN